MEVTLRRRVPDAAWFTYLQKLVTTDRPMIFTEG